MVRAIRSSRLPERHSIAPGPPLRDWFYVMFLFTTTRNGVAAKRVERELGVTYKTAWRMCHQIREVHGLARQRRSAWRPGETVEIDETLVGGQTAARAMAATRATRLASSGMLERGGELITRVATRQHQGKRCTASHSGRMCFPARPSTPTFLAATWTLTSAVIATTK
jgi:hypothetical protein